MIQVSDKGIALGLAAGFLIVAGPASAEPAKAPAPLALCHGIDEYENVLAQGLLGDWRIKVPLSNRLRKPDLSAELRAIRIRFERDMSLLRELPTQDTPCAIAAGRIQVESGDSEENYLSSSRPRTAIPLSFTSRKLYREAMSSGRCGVAGTRCSFAARRSSPRAISSLSGRRFQQLFLRGLRSHPERDPRARPAGGFEAAAIRLS